MTLIGNAIRAAKVGAKAVTKYQPFYSAADKAALALTRPKGTGKEFMTELKKTKGVKPTEIEHRKLEQIEQLPKMTKEQFLAELEKRPPAEVSENVLEPKTKKMRDDIAEELFPGRYDYTNYRDLDANQRQQVDEVMATRTTAYGDYQMPGGENYREILLQLPHFMDEERLMYLDAKRRHGGLHPVLAGEYEQLKEQKASFNPEYLSRHWEGNPNVLAHMRVSDRTTPEGKKILHVEEIQSDWHQEGREKGYKPVDYIKQSNALDKEFDDLGERRTQLLKQAELMPTHGSEFTNLIDEANSITPKLIKLQEQRDNIRNIINYGVPDAPFKKNWHELAMKRLINYASENGYDGIAITPGVEQAKRYDLSKHISEIAYDPIEKRLVGKNHEGKLVVGEENVTPEKLANYIGKEAAEKIMQAQPSQGGVQRLSGVDLQVGGEGMKGFYDKMLPDYLNQFGKPYGAQVELGGYKLKGDPSLRGEASERLGLAGERFDQMTPEEIEAFNAKLDEANAKSLHYFPITPQMREEVTQKGLPLYQQIGIPLGAGTAGTQVEVPQAPVQPEPTEEPAYAMGGAVYDTTPDMSDGGQILQGDAFKRGGKVHIADNPDTMFMELQDKKLAGGGLLKKALQAAKPAIKGMQEVLPIAEREANLKKFLEPSKIKSRVFHGTGANVNEFEPSVIGAMGPGTYVTGNPDVASQYSKVISNRRSSNDPNVLPLHVQVENPFPIKNVNRSGSEFFLHFDPSGKLSDEEVIELAKKAGYDAVHALEENELNIFDRNKIKSAIGNRGTYDINEPDITKRTGGLAHITRK